MSTLNISMDEYLKVMNGIVDNWSAVNIPSVPQTMPQGFTQTNQAHTSIMNPAPLVEDPRAFITFESKAATLKIKIRKALLHKLTDLPNELRKEIVNRCVLSGSSISSLYHDEKPKDYDLWARDSLDILLLKDMIKKESNLISEYSDKYDDTLPKEAAPKKLITNNAITLKNGIQFITIGTYEVCRKTFDLKHCLPYYILSTDTFVISRHQLELIARRKLEKVDPNTAVKDYRINKFLMRGWSF